MASTEADVPIRLVTLGEGDLPEALALSASARWNQNEADWRAMLAFGHARGIRAAAPDGVERLAASTLVLPYPGGFAWISMVLVDPAFRRRGFASLLLREATDGLERRGLLPVLDATPAGRAVYLKEGFVDAWGFRRYRREGAPAAPAAPAAAVGVARPLRDADWPAIAALDAPAFGADRLPLLRSLAARAPGCAWVLERGGAIVAYLLGRDGLEATQLGPLVCADADAEADAEDVVGPRTLLAAALERLAGPVQLDLVDRHAALQPWLADAGFALQRPFTRMVRAAPERARAPGDPARVVLVAGPELG
jgi:ribosomal protein S18 acetylase RimI-like enzyme